MDELFTAEDVNHEDLISAYKESCKKYNTDPLEIVISQLQVKVLFFLLIVILNSDLN